MDTQGLDNIRCKIDLINEQLTDLLVTRMKLVDQVAQWKAGKGLPVSVPEREKAILDKVCRQAGGEFSPEIESVFRAIFAASCAREERLIAESRRNDP